jgi:hypothetical protein
MAVSRQDLAVFDWHLDQLQREHEITLGPAERKQLLEASIHEGFSPDTTERLVAAHAESFKNSNDHLDDDVDDDDQEEFDENDPNVRLALDVDRDMRRLAMKRGLPLTKYEREVLVDSTVEQMRRGERVDVEGGLAHYYATTGVSRPDARTREGRSAFFTQRMAEGVEPYAPPDHDLDLGTREGRSEFYEARKHGVEFDEGEGSE